MDKPKTYNEWHSSLEGFEGLRHANCCRISYEAGQQSRQAEVDLINATHDGQMIGHDVFVKKLKDRHEEQVQGLAKAISKFEKEMDEKDKRIEQLQAKVDAVEHVLGCAMIGPKELFLYAERISKALRGEHD